MRGRIAGLVFTVIIPLVVAAMIPHITFQIGLPIIAVSVVIGLSDWIWGFSPLPWRKKLVPILLIAGGLLAIVLGGIQLYFAHQSQTNDAKAASSPPPASSGSHGHPSTSSIIAPSGALHRPPPLIVAAPASPQAHASSSAPQTPYQTPTVSPAAAVASITEQSVQGQRSYSREDMNTRQRALREISEYVVSSFDNFLKQAEYFRDSSKDYPKAKLLENANALRASIIREHRLQLSILEKYEGISDVFDLVDWNYEMKIMEPSIGEYIETARSFPDNPTVGSMAQFSESPTARRFFETIDNLPNWRNSLLRNVGSKRAEYEKAIIY